EANYSLASICNDNNTSGGAIFNQGALTINDSTLTANSAQGGTDGGSGSGGGIYMSAGTLSFNSSTLSDNVARGGNVAPGTDNEWPGDGYGGGLYIGGGTVSINNSTVADNQAIYGREGQVAVIGVGDGGGIYNPAGPSALQMYDTILADNISYWGAPDLNGGV